MEEEKLGHDDLACFLTANTSQLFNGFTLAEKKKAEFNKLLEDNTPLQLITSKKGSLAMAMAQDGEKLSLPR